MKPFDGSIHCVTTKAVDAIEADLPAWDEGYSTALSADSKRILLQVHDARGDVSRISLTAEQALKLSYQLWADASVLDIFQYATQQQTTAGKTNDDDQRRNQAGVEERLP